MTYYKVTAMPKNRNGLVQLNLAQTDSKKKHAQYAQVSLLRLRYFASSLLVSVAPTRLPLLFSSLTLVLSSPHCPPLHFSFYLKLSGRFGKNCLLSTPVLSGYNGSLDTCFSWGMTWLISWPNGEHY